MDEVVKKRSNNKDRNQSGFRSLLFCNYSPSFLRKQESMLLALIVGLRKNNELPMSTLNDNSDGFPRKRE